jgi:plasmid stability protein
VASCKTPSQRIAKPPNSKVEGLFGNYDDFVLKNKKPVEMGSDTIYQLLDPQLCQLGLSIALISLKSSITLKAPHRNGDHSMASITIRNLDDEIKQRLRVRAAERGHSMEEEARDILRRVTSEGSAPRNLAATIRARVAPADRVDLALPAREPMPEPPQFT